MILDAGVLISIDRGEESARTLLTVLERAGERIHSSDAVVAQVWRAGVAQARLASVLKAVRIHPLDDGRAVGLLLGRSGASDVVDAHLVLLALELQDDILTGDVGDLEQIASGIGPARPTIRAWPA